ncbi:tyrosine-type recombinase/integrase [Azospirillum sp.]|uniref:tyrosine-type recombinase/integrase n=1 Tax=Azospirillum sp. TaxID=34012 RepID=UPI003D735392
MAGRQAKILSDAQLDQMLEWCSNSRYPLRNRVVVLLSVKAGLRAMEIAKVLRRHVTDPAGAASDVLDLEDAICKKGSGRTVPMHPLLRESIAELLAARPGGPNVPLILSERALREDPNEPGTGCIQPMEPKSIGYLFFRMYRDLGFSGCSSHSGRRTFITRAARNITKAGGSLRDVQQLAGHAQLTTTQRYIEGSNEAKRAVVALI